MEALTWNEPLLEEVQKMVAQDESKLIEASQQYEQEIIKLEAQARQHISIQQQLKIYVEAYQEKLEMSEKKMKETDTELFSVKNQLSKSE